MPFSPIWPQPRKNWNFDVSSLSVLIGEQLELQYRLSRRSLWQCISAAPVVGLQNYIRSYDLLLEPGSLTYSNPYGCAKAPLRNVQLENAIKLNNLLEDTNFNVYTIPPQKPPCNRYNIILNVWSAVTWLIYGGILAFAILAPHTTWIGIANVTILTGWSIIVRVIEYFNVVPSKAKKVNKPGDPDAIYILGRDNSGFVLKGSREDIKRWVTRGLIYKSYKSRIPGTTQLFQGFTRFTSLLVLLFVFSTLPNGHTMDQLAFIILNAMAQVNVLLGQWLNSVSCMSELHFEETSSCKVVTRTDVYGRLIKEFKDVNDGEWITALDLLPKTRKWSDWKTKFLDDVDQDPKDLYNSLPGR